jgi:hypothetical protein
VRQFTEDGKRWCESGSAAASTGAPPDLPLLYYLGNIE